MDLYIGTPHSYVKPTSLGYALSHEMKSTTIIEKYKPLNRLILDNGADELGEGQRGSRLAYLAGKLNPDWIILPDVLHRDKETRKRGLEFYENMKDTGYKGKFMSVIQAKTIDKGIKSYKFWASTGIVDRIGITYDTQIKTPWVDEIWGNRLGFLYDLTLDNVYQENPIPFHMLGTLEVAELFTLHRNPMFKEVLTAITSHDTTAPWACTTKFKVTDNGISFGRPKSWNRLDFDATLTDKDLEIRYWNIACYLTACLVPMKDWEHYIPRNKVSNLFEQLMKFYG